MKKHVWKRLLLILTALLLACGLGFFLYLQSYYPADETAAAIARSSDVSRNGRFTVLEPTSAPETGIVFYPGAKVEDIAYLPLLNQLRDQGFACVLADMPFHMAFFDTDAAWEAMAQLPEVKHWYLCGHSLGGAMASRFAARNPDAVDGLILLGAYIYGDYPPADTLTIYGSLNAGVGEKINYTENIVVIRGGNHAQFGNYGPQAGDLPAEISPRSQQAQAVKAIIKFIKTRSE